MILKEKCDIGFSLKVVEETEKRIAKFISQIIPQDLIDEDLETLINKNKAKKNFEKDTALEQNKRRILNLYSKNQVNSIISIDEESTKKIVNQMKAIEPVTFTDPNTNVQGFNKKDHCDPMIKGIFHGSDNFVNLHSVSIEDINEPFVLDTEIKRGKRYQAFTNLKGKDTYTILFEDMGEKEYDYLNRKANDYLIDKGTVMKYFSNPELFEERRIINEYIT